MKKDLILGIGLILFAAVLFVELQKTENPAIMQDEVTAAIFPSIMAGALALLGACLAAAALHKLKKGKGRPTGTAPRAAGWAEFRRVYTVPLLLFVLLCFYIFLTPVVGFYTMTVSFFIATGILLGGGGRKNLTALLPTVLVTVLIVYYVFQVYMRVIMPSGLIY